MSYGRQLFLLHLSVLLLLQVRPARCPDVQIAEPCINPCQFTRRQCSPNPQHVTPYYHRYPIPYPPSYCPYCPQLPHPCYPPPASPPFCVQSVVIEGREGCKVHKEEIKPRHQCHQYQPYPPSPFYPPFHPTFHPYYSPNHHLYNHVPPPQYPLHQTPNASLYEVYLEKVLALLKDKKEADEGPTVVFQKKRRSKQKKKARRYKLTPIDDEEESPIILVDEDCEDVVNDDDEVKDDNGEPKINVRPQRRRIKNRTYNRPLNTEHTTQLHLL